MSIESKSPLVSGRQALRSALDRAIDLCWGIDTLKGAWAHSEKAAQFNDASRNVPVSYYQLFRVLGRTSFTRGDTFYDIGCGNGRVICYVARKRISKVIGIELSSAFAEKASSNARKLRGRLSPVEVRCGDAVKMDFSDGTLFYMFHPFGPDTLQAVLDNIRKTLASHDRPMMFMYQNPVHSSVFRSCGWLTYAGERRDRFASQRMEMWKYTPSRPVA